MIVHSNFESFTLIEQDYHAYLSEIIIRNWKNLFFKSDTYIKSVLYAIRHHDCGWTYFDKQPFLNDENETPYSFTDFPLLPRLALYQNGVNDVELHDPYGAALCSAHYTKFLNKHSESFVMQYLEIEQLRRERILSNLPHITEELFNKHLAILQFADNISLYICLNKPGTRKQDEHYFFKHGIPICPSINATNKDKIDAHWGNKDKVIIKGLPYANPVKIRLKFKQVQKERIKKTSLIEAYEQTPYEQIKFDLVIK